MRGVHVALLRRLAFSLMLSMFRFLLGTRFVPDPDRVIEEDGELVINNETWRVMPTPGHSFDHISLYHPGRGILLGGDNVLMEVTPWLGPPWSNLKDYIKSLESMLELPGLSVILPAHGSIIHEPRKRIELLIHWRRKRLQDILDIVRQSGEKGISSAEALDTIYGRMNAYRRFMARGWVVLSLSCLEKEGRVYSRGPGRDIRYYVNQG
jgi:glyoxylase-like metal-dependent hydrolase (beta-lactamase superfamily II)